MVLEKHHTSLLDFILKPLEKVLRHVNPNWLTWSSLPLALLAASMIYRGDPATELQNGYLLWASGVIIVIGILDLLDGRIARTSGKAGPAGDFLDHTMDRFVDIILIIAIALSPWADLRVGLFALVGTLLTSYMGTQAQAVGAGRVYGGFLTRADRIIILIAAPIVDHVFVAYEFTLGLPGGTDYALGIVLYYFAIMGIFTSMERFVRVLRTLGRKKDRPPQGGP